MKYNCDHKFGLISQCFNISKLLDTPLGYFDNFLLKLNGKMGGLNAVIDPSEVGNLSFMAKTMLIGLDVNHASETEHISSSVAAAVGSLDSFFSSYTASIRIQKKEKDEIVKYLDQMIIELLKEFFLKNNFYPENLIIFRDGVSDSMFEMVKKIEIPLIQAGINKIGKPMKIILIIIQKQHLTRFALVNVNSSGRKPTFNVPSGTVVDNTIVNPIYPMFYLNSHFSPLASICFILYIYYYYYYLIFNTGNFSSHQIYNYS